MNDAAFSYISCWASIIKTLCSNASATFLDIFYANRKLFWYISFPRNLLRGSHSSCMVFLSHQFSIQLAPFSSLPQRRMYECMIFWNKSSSKSLKLDFVKFPPLQFILLVCPVVFSSCQLYLMDEILVLFMGRSAYPTSEPLFRRRQCHSREQRRKALLVRHGPFISTIPNSDVWNFH